MKKNNLIRKAKQGAAGLLAGAMVLTGFPLSTITALAASVTGQTVPISTNLENDAMLMEGRPNDGYGTTHNHYYQHTPGAAPSYSPTGPAYNKYSASYGNGTTTGYKYGWIRQGSYGSFAGWKWDINGMVDDVNTEPATENDEAFVKSYNTGGSLSVTYPSYDPQGFNTAIHLGSDTITDSNKLDIGKNNIPRDVSTGSPFYPGYDGEIKNGEVVKVFDPTTHDDLKLEIKLSIKPTTDGKYILSEYTVKNTNMNPAETNNKIVDAGRTDGGRTVWFASGTDTMIAGDDWAPVWSTPKTNTGDKNEGIHGQGNNGSTYTLGSFDMLTYSPQYPNLGIHKRDASDPSKITTWVGQYTQFNANYGTDLVDTSYMPGGTNPSLDSGIAYSLKFDLLPGEEKSGVIAWSMRGPTYYVDPVNGNDSNNGFMSTPVKTIERAVSLIGSRTPKKTYIYVMNDVDLGSTITVPAGKSITIGTTDYVLDPSTNSKVAAYPIQVGSDGQRTNQKSVKRKAGFTGPLFKVDDPTSSISFTDVIVNGAGDSVNDITSPLVLATAGTVNTLTGGVLKNNKITPVEHEQYTDTNHNGQWDTGEPFIDANGNGTFDGPETFTDTNGNGKYDVGEPFVDANRNGIYDKYANATVASAIDLSGSAKLNMNYGTIIDNTSYMGGAVTKNAGSEVSLSGAVKISGNTSHTGGASNLMVDTTGSTAKVTSSVTGASRIGLSSLQLVPLSGVTVVEANNGTGAALPYNLGNYTADKNGQSVVYGNASGTQVNLNAIAVSYAVSHVLMDGSTVPGTSTTSTLTTAGAPVAIAPVNDPAYLHTVTYTNAAGQTLTSPEVTPGGHGLSVEDSGVSGYLPGNDITVIFRYVRNESVAKFDPAGGVPTSIADVVSPAGGAPTASLPLVSRTGYDFVGWFKYTDANNNNRFDTGDTVTTTSPTGETGLDNPVVAGTVHYVAKWTPSTTPYNFDVIHKNSSTTLPISFATNTTPHPFLDPIAATPITVPGYRLYTATQTPATPNYFDPTNNFNGVMAIGGTTVKYTYRVDPSVRKTFKVEHIDTSTGAVMKTTTVYRSAEAAISAAPLTTLGYSVTSTQITAGNTSGGANVLTVADMQTAAGITPGFNADHSFTGYMPNQDVTIRYEYANTTGYFAVQKFIDSTTNERIGNLNPISFANAAAMNVPYTGVYGYLFGSATANPAAGTFDAAGNFTGVMPSANVNLDYQLNRDPAYWKTMNFAVANAPYNHGVVPSSTFNFLRDDHTAAASGNAYTFQHIIDLGGVPTPAANPQPYYKFEGWYLDAAATTPVTAGMTFDNDVTLYAKFVEDPAYWIDINFASGDHGSISAPSSLHTYYDNKWGNILGSIPTTTPELNYLFQGWKTGSNAITNASPLTNGATYTANFGKDPNTWGTNMGSISPVGRIGSNGSGEIVIDGTTPGNVYVISDPDGNIVAVVPGDASGSRTVVPNLVPGAHYNVQEGTPDTVATVGQPISSITGTSVSTPQDVYIPTVDNNYSIGYDPDNDGMAQIVVNPADPDADYALIDENGNVVNYPGSDNGWMTPVGSNPSTVTFNNLNPNATYTVVARKKGNSAIPNPLTKLPDGNQIVANPGDMAEATKYVVETKQGSIVTVGTDSVGSDTYSEAKAGDSVVIHADPVDANGKNFLYWKVLAGRAVGVSGKITQADYTFTLSNSNIVLKAVYEPTKVAGDDANVEEDLRGKAGVGEFGLEPSQIPALANLLTTPADRALNTVNGATVDYKVIFDKRDTTAGESNLVKPVSYSGINHPGAYTAAYSLDIKLERYVDGRRVDAGISTATASNATVDVISQLPASDVDQLDYQLFDVTTGTPVEATITTDVANNAGLVKFTGNLLHTYVMVYSKAFKVTFIDNKPVLDNLHLNDTSRNFYKQFKVRKKDNVEDSDYASDYGIVTAYAQNDVPNALVTPFEDIYGVQYDYKNWSKKEDKLSVFDTTGELTKKTTVYAYYSNNKKEVAQARVDLDKTIDSARDLTSNPYLKLTEVAEINEAIAKAVETLRQARDLVSPDGTTYLRQANYAELQQAIDALRAVIDKYSKGTGDREAARIKRTGGASGGGNSSSGRGSKLLMPGEKSQQNTAINEGSNTRSFVLGVDGAWEKNKVTGGWSFILNGGTPINDMWGMITFNDNTGKKVSRWYYFDAQSTMATGWVYDSKNGNWYYMNTTEGPDLGQMVRGWVKDSKTSKWYYMDDNTGILSTGWHKDKQDGRWYYLNSNGEMVTGWQNIGGKWYYFNTNTPEKTYEWDAAAFKWNYLNNSQRPYGSMYAGETTPDGYSVDANGAWN